MKKLFCLLSVLALASCAHHPQHAQRKTASVGRDLTGTYLGVADYGKHHRGHNKKAVRIYFDPIASEPGKYNVVLLEYVDLLAMAPSYIASNKLPIVAKTFGFLKNITQTVAAYEAAPGEKENTLELYPLVRHENQIVAKKDVAPRILTLGAEGLENPLAGATISPGNESEPKEIFFPTKDDNKKNGIQYGTAKLAYEKAKLESTWRKNYLRGPYLSQYYRRDDVVLHCNSNNGVDGAEFVLGGEKFQKLSQKKRTKMFTHPDSAYLQGGFTVTEPRDGMFLLHAGPNADERTANVLQNKIGLFIDIFDATKSLNQDVVELVFADSERPEDFLMYYEDPKNGEGGPR